ncbi:MAG: ATP-binding cassette domain-containing protein [Prolixibacteraceae bacterium]|nr:ATP-binding cassette domain-containing protein [Prolixibacteraceae bacterium]
MNEITLNALINLFALFSAISDSKKEEAIRVFSFYLQLNPVISDTGEYLKLFEELLDFYGVDGEAALPIDLDHQARSISENVKTRLRKDEQVMVFLRFLELAKHGNKEKAESLFITLSQVFEINEKEYLKFSDFIFHGTPKQSSPEWFMIIDNNQNSTIKGVNHKYEKNLNGKLVFLSSPLIGHLIFTFYGKEDLTLEGNPIQPERFYAFKEGSIIRGPRVMPIYYIDISSQFHRDEKSKPFVFSGQNLNFRFNHSDNGLHNFTFSESSGQLVAIMGGSGVGKSTLVNILNGNIPVQQGSVKINGFDIYKNKKEIEGLIGYVPQDDLLFDDLTVWENLYYNACLCFDGLSKTEIVEKVSLILHELELFPFKDLKVGSPLKKIISGGQRKRLNVAMELIREPSILFVDEPTSGLSSIDSETVMLLLKQQARKGKLIFVNIHQPSSAIFKLFDKLWILDKGGRPIYTGNPLDAIIYFKSEANHANADVCECVNCGNVNPEQVLEIIESKTIDSSGAFTEQRRFTPEYWHALYLKKMHFRDTKIQQHATLPDNEAKKPGLIRQFRIFFERNLRTKITDKQYLAINLLEAPLLALIVGYFTRFTIDNEYIFFENKSYISYLFMSIVVLLFMGMSISAEEIIKDRKILQRESFLNLSRFSYINSKVLFLLLLSAFQAFSFVVVGNLILEIQHMNFVYWIVLFSLAFFANLLGLNISSAFDSVVTIYILIPLLLIPQILLCGVIVKFDDLQNNNATKDAVPIVGEMMVSRWAFEALAVEQYRSNKYMAFFFDVEKDMAQSRFRSNILTTELIGQTDILTSWYKLNTNLDKVDQKRTLIHNEIKKLDSEVKLDPFAHSKSLIKGEFNVELADSIKNHLLILQSFHTKRFRKLQKEKDQVIMQLNSNNGSNYLYNLKMEHHNKALESMVLNTEYGKAYRETPYGIMQKIAPIFKAPDFEYGRAHFFAPHKNLFGIKISTLWFNLGVIWFFSIFLYVALYYCWLRKVLKIKLSFNKKKLE